MPRFLIRTLMLSMTGALALAIAAPSITAQAPKPPASVILKGAPIGGVRLDHAAHTDTHKVACTTCHHPSMKQKPAKSDYQKCSDCHTKVAAAPMKTNYRDAFHDAMAKSGLCVTCHMQENKKGKKAPLKCNECHKKEHG
jgi:hypothetical protein